MNSWWGVYRMPKKRDSKGRPPALIQKSASVQHVGLFRRAGHTHRQAPFPPPTPVQPFAADLLCPVVLRGHQIRHDEALQAVVPIGGQRGDGVVVRLLRCAREERAQAPGHGDAVLPVAYVLLLRAGPPDDRLVHGDRVIDQDDSSGSVMLSSPLISSVAPYGASPTKSRPPVLSVVGCSCRSDPG
jgi:hypothetical protein